MTQHEDGNGQCGPRKGKRREDPISSVQKRPFHCTLDCMGSGKIAIFRLTGLKLTRAHVITRTVHVPGAYKGRSIRQKPNPVNQMCIIVPFLRVVLERTGGRTRNEGNGSTSPNTTAFAARRVAQNRSKSTCSFGSKKGVKTTGLPACGCP